MMLRPLLAGLVAVVVALVIMAACRPDSPPTLGQHPVLPMYECHPIMDHGRMFWSCKTTDLQRK